MKRLFIILGCDKKEKITESPNKESAPTTVEGSKLKTSNTIPYAVMINNLREARPHAGLNEAYLVYEMPVEYGITRMFPLFKDAEAAKIGSVRSSRPYYLDYVLENDAIYVYFGGSDQAYKYIPSLKINNIDGNAGESFRTHGFYN